MSTRRSIRYRYLKTKLALGQTVQAILDINRKRRIYQDSDKEKQALEEELKVLNAVAENHAMVLKKYEHQLGDAEPKISAVPIASYPNLPSR